MKTKCIYFFVQTIISQDSHLQNIKVKNIDLESDRQDSTMPPKSDNCVTLDKSFNPSKWLLWRSLQMPSSGLQHQLPQWRPLVAGGFESLPEIGSLSFPGDPLCWDWWQLTFLCPLLCRWLSPVKSLKVRICPRVRFSQYIPATLFEYLFPYNSIDHFTVLWII